VIIPRKGKELKYCVYILFSETRLKFYVVQSQNFEKRPKRHNKGQVPSTKSGIPWDLVKLIEVKSRTEAMKLEHKI